MPYPEIEYLKAMAEIGYPFETTQATASELTSLISDMLVVVPRTVTSGTVTLDRLTVVSNVITRLVIKCGATTLLNYNSAAVTNIEVNASNFGDWRTMAFRVTSTSSEGELDAQVKVVINKAYLDALANNDWTSQALPLVNHCQEFAQNKVNSLIVGVDQLAGDILFDAGYNTTLSDVAKDAPFTDDSRPIITISVSPGTGLGRRPSECNSSDNTVVRTINGVPANADLGDFVVETDGCHYLYTDTSATSPNFVVHNACTSCLDCTDTLNTYCVMRGVWTNAQTIRTRLCESLLVYSDYLTLLKRFICELNKTKVAVSVEQTDDEAADIIFRLQVGSTSPITSFNVNFTYGPGAVVAQYRDYSGKRKLPGQAYVPLSPPFETGFDGTSINFDVSDYSGEPIPVNRYAVWYWNMILTRCDTSTNVDVSWSGTIYREDLSTFPVSGSTSFNIDPVSCP